MDVGSAGPAVDEQTRCEEQRPGDARVKPCFRDGFARALNVLVRGAQIQPILQRVNERADEGANCDGELHEAGLEDAEVVRVAEGLHYGAEE